MAVQSVLFDLDGTLFDHEGASKQAISAWLEERGVIATNDVIAEWFASERRHFGSFVDGAIVFEQQRRLRLMDLGVAAGLDLPAADASLDALFAEYLQRYELAWRLFPDALDAVLQVRAAGLAVGIMTNGHGSQQRRKIERCGLAALFPRPGISEELGQRKPDAAAFIAACALTGFDPETTCMVGDNHDVDVLGARSAGLRAVHLDRTNSGIHDPHGISTLDNLTEAIKELP